MLSFIVVVVAVSAFGHKRRSKQPPVLTVISFWVDVFFDDINNILYFDDITNMQ